MTRRGAPRKRFDPLDVIESAYAVDLPDDEWLAGVLAKLSPAIDNGLGTLAYFYDATKRPLAAWGFTGNVAPTREELIAVLSAADDDYVAQSYLVTPYGTASEQPGFDRQRSWDEHLQKYGIADALVVNGFDLSGHGVWLGAPLPERRTVREGERRRWAKLAAHVVAGLRLRRRTRTEPDAVIGTNGKVEHVRKDLEDERHELALAAKNLDRARGRLRREDPDGAVEAWKVLVRARWSLVDAFESDGKRWVVAHSNPMRSAGPESFSDREREIVALLSVGHTAKLVAYELGLSPSTVRVHLTNASRKVDARSREDLIAKYRAWLTAATPSAARSAG